MSDTIGLVATFSILLLGPFEALLGGQRLERFRTSRVQALCAYLAVEAPAVHRREALCDLLWPGLPARSAAENLRQTLYQLRRAIHSVPARSGGPEQAWIVADRQSLRVNPEAAYSLDAARFEALLRGQQPGNAPDRAALEEAVALYRGDFLSGFSVPDSSGFENWAQARRAAYRRLAQDARARLAALSLAQRHYAAAEAHARQRLALDDLSEGACRQLMEALALAGDRSAALAEFEACRRRLQAELNVAPEPATLALVEAIASGRLSVSAPDTPMAVAFESELRQTDETPHVFVARQREMQWLEQGLARAVAGQGGVLFVTGEAGRGKSALLAAFSRRAVEAYPGLVAAGGNCTALAGAGDPYLPFRDVLGQLSGASAADGRAGGVPHEQARRLAQAAPITLQVLLEDAPDLLDVFVPAAALERQARAQPEAARWLARLEERAQRSPTARQPGHLHEQYAGVLRGLAARRPLLICLDDLQWADTASINLLFHLGRRLAGSPVLLVGAYRLSDVALGRPGDGARDAQHPLRPVVGELVRQWGDIQLDLGQDTPDEGRAFIEALIDAEPNNLDAGFRAAFYDRTKGHALFAVELLRDLQLRGVLARDDDGRWERAAALDWGQLPARTEAVIAQRLDQVPSGLRTLLSAASVEGEEFSVQVLARVLGRPEREVLHDLAQVLERQFHLVRGRGEAHAAGARLFRFQFAHVLFQHYLYQQLDPAERSLLHADVAAALEGLYGVSGGEAAVALAYHHAQAGHALEAARCLLEAGDRARIAYAHEAAVDHYLRALPLLQAAGDAEAEARTQLKLGLVYTIAFDFARAHAAYTEGFRLWQAVGAGRPVPHLPSAPHPLRLAWRDPESLDPTLGGASLAAPIVTQLFSGLVSQTPEMEVVPDVAERWEVQDEGRRYVFHLRRDVYWSDGVPVTAADFEFTFKRALDPATRAPVAGLLLHAVRGARDFNTGGAPDASGVGLWAEDAHTLVFELEAPTSYFFHDLSYYVLYPVPKHVIEAHGAAWAEPEHFVGNGPFVLDRWARGQDLWLRRNPRYHGRVDGNVDRVHLRLEVEPEREVELYAAGELDVVYNWFLPSVLMETPRRRSPAEFTTRTRFMVHYYFVDVTQPPFQDVRVRRALAMALDRPAIVRQVNGDYALPGTAGFVPPGMPGHSPDIGLPFDPAQARRLLAEAGYPSGRGLPPFHMVAGPIRESLAAAMVAAWRQELGLEVRLSVTEASILEVLIRDRPHLAAAGWWADYADPDNFLRVCVELDVPAWQHAEYQRLLEQARQLTDQAARMRFYQQADRLLMEAGVVVPLQYDHTLMMLKPWVRSFPTTPVKNPGFWKDVILEPHAAAAE